MSAKKPPIAAKTVRRDIGKVIVNTALRGEGVATINFGEVSVKAASPKVGELRRNVTIGQAAMARAMPKLVKPGVAFKTAESTPLFRADPRDPSRLIREVNGRVSTGTFVNGKFKVVSTKR
ncbi:hypothetical protein [Rhizobacter sp. OV335]|jgi:hypothetical protein|uniref:hypothetical protein n=1 Tax=Rhizobacter sp. OV335 TaxID=1500264 RepID=UPI000914EA54|nr:hypothetical protein [Rhizobacter sp. OV335]SHN02251.1 hypothetical protein SAMN02787076_02962 [Rhizobacter sp. OV335]